METLIPTIVSVIVSVLMRTSYAIAVAISATPPILECPMTGYGAQVWPQSKTWISGIGTTNFPPHSRMKAFSTITSSLRFQARIKR